MISGDYVVYTNLGPDRGSGLVFNKTYKVKQSIGYYVYVYLTGNNCTFDSTRSFRLATEKEIADFQIKKMFENYG